MEKPKRKSGKGGEQKSAFYRFTDYHLNPVKSKKAPKAGGHRRDVPKT